MDVLLSKYEVDRSILLEDVQRFLNDSLRNGIFVNKEIEDNCDQHIANIQAIQDDIPGLKVSDFGYVARLGERLTPGCGACQKGKWAVFYVGPRCDLHCFFCPYVEPSHAILPQIEFRYRVEERSYILS